MLVKMKFKGTEHLPEYHGSFSAYDGGNYEVDEDEARRLKTDFPDNWALMGELDGEMPKVYRAPADRMIRIERVRCKGW